MMAQKRQSSYAQRVNCSIFFEEQFRKPKLLPPENLM